MPASSVRYLDRRLGWLALGAIAGLVVATAVGPLRDTAPARAANDPAPEHTISVSGTGTVTVVPDTADVALGVSIQRLTVKEAQADAAEAMNAVLAALRKLGIADRDIRTTTLSLSPVYEYPPNGGQKLIGYQFTNGVMVTVRDFTKIADVVDGALAAGANTLDGVSFRVADGTRFEDQARSAAMADAKRRAEALAKVAGVSIVDIASISESSTSIPYPIAFGSGAADKATPISPGTSDVTVSVSVTYVIE